MQAIDRRERLRRLALETIDLSKDPYFMRNHLGQYECRLCLTLHNNEGNYLAHTQVSMPGNPHSRPCYPCHYQALACAAHWLSAVHVRCSSGPLLTSARVEQYVQHSCRASGISRTWPSVQPGRPPRSQRSLHPSAEQR